MRSCCFFLLCIIRNFGLWTVTRYIMSPFVLGSCDGLYSLFLRSETKWFIKLQECGPCKTELPNVLTTTVWKLHGPLPIMHQQDRAHIRMHSIKLYEGKLLSGSARCSGRYSPNTQLWIPVQKTTVCQLAGLTSVLRHLPPARQVDSDALKDLCHNCHIQRILSKCFCSYISDFIRFQPHSCTRSHLTTDTHTLSGQMFPESSRRLES